MMEKSYLMPAEWENQVGTWLAWPHNRADWPDKFAPIPWVYSEIIRYLTRVQRVRLVVKNEKQTEQAREILDRAGVALANVDFLTAPTDRVWLRDSGAILVKDAGQKTLIDWKFTAWAKYENWKRDDKMPLHMEAFLNLPREQPFHNGRRVVLEGGSIDVNGKGTLITTEECLMSENIQCRNPGFTKQDYASVFGKYLGITNVIWLENGIVGDDTHGHVDDITRFTDASTVVTVVEKDASDPNHPLLAENVKRLKAARDQDGRQLNVVELPMPRPVIFEDQRLPASYANFLIANNMVLVPVFNDPADRIALNILAECFPKRDIVPIFCGDFVWGLGTIHCASQQEPA